MIRIRRIVFLRKHRKRQMITQGAETQNYNGGRTRKLTHDRGLAKLMDDPVYKPACYAGRGINIGAKHKRHLIDQYIAYHSAKRSCDDTHHQRHPHGIVDGQSLVDPDHTKHGQTDAVENEKHPVVAYK